MGEVFTPILNLLKRSVHLDDGEKRRAIEELQAQLPPPGRRTVGVAVELSVNMYPPRLQVMEHGGFADGNIARERFRYDWGAPIRRRYGFASPEHANGNHYHENNSTSRPLTDLGINDPETRMQLVNDFIAWVGRCGVET